MLEDEGGREGRVMCRGAAMEMGPSQILKAA
jgi:hypothetical protein